jgi:hypothetical protein
MNRRRFLRLLGIGTVAVAAEEVIPLNRVWSFSKTIVPANAILLPPGASVRFIRAWDAIENRMMSRFDMAYGFGPLSIPLALESAEQWHNPTDKPKVWHAAEDIPYPLVAKVREMADERAHLGDQQIFGACITEPVRYAVLD